MLGYIKKEKMVYLVITMCVYKKHKFPTYHGKNQSEKDKTFTKLFTHSDLSHECVIMYTVLYGLEEQHAEIRLKIQFKAETALNSEFQEFHFFYQSKIGPTILLE